MNIKNLLKLSPDAKTAQSLLKYQGEMNSAMAKFRNKVKPPKKNGHVSFHTKYGYVKYDYVYLDDLIKSIDKGLKGTGLTWRQKTDASPKDVEMVSRNGQGYKTLVEEVSVSTIIKFKNGWESDPDSTTVIAQSTSPQDIGSALSYAKRYSLATAFGINANTDTDGAQSNHSSSRSSYSGSGSQTTYKASPNKKASAAQIKFLNSLIGQLATMRNADQSKVRDWILGKMNVSQASSASSAQVSQGITVLKSLVNGEQKKAQAQA